MVFFFFGGIGRPADNESWLLKEGEFFVIFLRKKIQEEVRTNPQLITRNSPPPWGRKKKT